MYKPQKNALLEVQFQFQVSCSVRVIYQSYVSLWYILQIYIFGVNTKRVDKVETWFDNMCCFPSISLSADMDHLRRSRLCSCCIDLPSRSALTTIIHIFLLAYHTYCEMGLRFYGHLRVPWHAQFSSTCHFHCLLQRPRSTFCMQSERSNCTALSLVDQGMDTKYGVSFRNNYMIF